MVSLAQSNNGSSVGGLLGPVRRNRAPACLPTPPSATSGRFEITHHAPQLRQTPFHAGHLVGHLAKPRRILELRACQPSVNRFCELGGFHRGVWGGSFVRPIVRQFLFSFEAFRSSLIQDFCPMLSLFFRPHFNRGFGPVRGDPNDMPS